MHINRPFYESLKKICFLLLVLGLPTAISVSAQVSQVFELMYLPGSSAKVEIAGDDWFVLPKHSKEVQQRSLTGDLKASYHAGSIAGLEVVHALDFTFDREGRMHALLWARDQSQRRSYAIIRKFENPQSYTHINLPIPIHAWQLDIDGKGNYYLFGVENEAFYGASRSRQTVKASTINLIYKFSPNGAFLSSFFQTPTPQTIEEIRSLAGSIYESDLAVLPDGEVFVLWEPPERGRSHILQVPNKLYHIRSDGTIESLEFQSLSATARITGIHKYGSNVVLEWVKFKGSGKAVESVELALLTGNSQSTLRGGITGQVLAIAGDKCITSVLVPHNGLKLLLNTLTP